ncbi:MAG: ribonuclease [Clostridia bacterium]|nr:ribonuclease [Clostridia bacterium]MBQ4620777.1 ribonuclease [Clostridia bacterium]MBQ9856721.1 ribonuclease [Clostridia bacterium]
MKRWLTLLMALFMMLVLCACSESTPEAAEILVEDGVVVTENLLVEYGYDYFSDEEVALYLYVFRELPANYLTKNEAYDLGWVSSKGNLWSIGNGLVIGGDKFGNREGRLPDARGRQWYEADVNYEGGYRGSERILFSNDGLIYVTFDHYETFTLLYDGWFEDELNLYRYPEDAYANALYDEYYIDPYSEIYGN